jgi:hypothetical protein
MKIATSGVTIETMGTFKEAEFGIGDPALFLEYLRKTIYSNPKKAICQELMSNARDAHREVGLADRPIRVKLPNKFDKTWQCRDWGPGIDPRRMVDVFVKFGCSTKRGGDDANATDDGGLQTGGFGIGAKTPWAYTDSFTICTRAMEGDELVERTYIAIIAEDRKSKLMELDGSMRVIDMNDPSIPDDDKHTGTTIIVDVKPDDFDDFKSYTIRVAKFWDPRPELTGCDPLPDWPEVTEKYAGTNWKIVEESGGYGRGYYYGNASYAIIDGIPYKLDTSAIEDMTDEMSRLCRAGVQLFFPVNAISVALSREAIQYDEPTQKAIRTLLGSAVDEIKTKLKAEISGAKSLWEAKMLWSEVCRTFDGGNIIDNVPWTAPDGTELEVNTKEIRGFDYYDSGIRNFRMEKNYDGTTKMKSKKASAIKVHAKTRLVLNDDGTLQPSRLKIEALFDKYEAAGEDVDSIQVVTPKSQDDLDKWNKENHLNYLDPIKLSSVVKKKKKRTKRSDGTVRQVTKAYKFIPNNTGRWQRAWKNADVDLKTEGGVYVEFERSGAVGIDDSELRNMMKAADVDEVVGIPTRFLDKKGDDWIELRDKVKEVYDEAAADLDLADVALVHKHADKTVRSCMSYIDSVLMDEVLPLLKDKNCLMAQWIKESDRIEQIRKEVSESKILALASMAGVNIGDVTPSPTTIEGMHDRIKDAYPLIQVMQSYSVRAIPSLAQELADYINGKGV